MADHSKIEWTDASFNPIRARLSYDSATGLFTWRDGRRAGQVAGKRDHHGYVQLVINRRAYMAHRLAWLFMTGEWPANEIDHCNGQKNDNRWDNLRLASRSQNCANKGKQSNNTSGFRGVTRHGNRWRAQINITGRRTLLGVFDTAEAASQRYEEAYQREFGEFAR